MLEVQQRIFAHAANGDACHLHPGVVVAAHDGRYTVWLDPPPHCAIGQELLLYYDDLRMFVQQRARVVAVHARPAPERTSAAEAPSDGAIRFELVLIGEPVCAERRAVARVPTDGAEIFASIDGSELCQVIEVSSCGFAIAGEAEVEEGARAEAVLIHGAEDLNGSVAICNVRDIGDGRRRFGVVCLDGLLKFALRGVNLAIQREQLRRLSQRAVESGGGWSLPTLARLARTGGDAAGTMAPLLADAPPLTPSSAVSLRIEATQESVESLALDAVHAASGGAALHEATAFVSFADEPGAVLDVDDGDETQTVIAFPRAAAAALASQPADGSRLTLRFPTLLAFEQELEQSIARGTLHVPSGERFAAGERVAVELDLSFCGHRVMVAAEVSAPAPLGCVCVRLLDSAESLRNVLAEIHACERGSLDAWQGSTPGLGPRHRRTATRVAAVITTASGSRPAHTRNLSRSGALLAMEGPRVPIGERLEVTLVDPAEGSSVRVPARAVRHVERDGGTAAIGVRFEIDPNRAGPVTCFLEALQAPHESARPGRIAGTLATLGLPNLLQMLALCVDEGTLHVAHGGIEAHILFRSGALCYCRVGEVTGLKALARVLDWEDGDFAFSPTLGRDTPKGVPAPIDSVLLECSHQVDELRRIACYPLPGAARFGHEPAPQAPLSAAHREVAELAAAGRTVQQILDAFPVYDTEIYRVLDTLLEQGILALHG
jgi:hypothetical protein